jgi:hypothetical protein
MSACSELSFLPPLHFPYATAPNSEWILYALPAQNRAVNMEALRHG